MDNRIPKKTKCSIASCGRNATHFLLDSMMKHKYLCDCCYRAYYLGRNAMRKKLNDEKKKLYNKNL